MALLPDERIASALATELPGWRREGDVLTRTIEATDFPAGIELVRRVADAAEAAQHHPDIDIRWTAITFRLSTHSAGGITDADLALAATIDRLS